MKPPKVRKGFWEPREDHYRRSGQAVMVTLTEIKRDRDTRGSDYWPLSKGVEPMRKRI